MRKSLLSQLLLFSIILLAFRPPLSHPELLHFIVDGSKASFKKVYLKDMLAKNRINMITFGCPINHCKPIEKEVKQLNTLLLSWREIVDFSYSVIIEFPKSADESDSSKLYTIAWTTHFMANSNKWNFPIYYYYLHDQIASLEDIYDFRSTPTTILFDQKGNIYYKTKGFLSKKSDFDSLFMKLKQYN